MYRRYYQRYDRFGASPQRPIGEDTHEDNELQDNNINSAAETTAEPEIIIPEKPSQVDSSQISQTLKPPVRRISRPSSARQGISLSNLFGRFGKDDLLLLGLIFIILQEEIDDELLLIILIFLLFAGL